MSTSRGMRIAGRIIKAVSFGLIFGIIILLLWRLFSAGTPKELKALTPNERLAAAYEEDGNDLYMFKQDLQSITTASYNRGYFGITEYVIIPEANQIQLVFRYNNSTIRKVAEDKKLDPVPSTDAYLFDVSLCVMTDLTPDNDKDNYGNIEETVKYTRILPSETSHAQKSLYNYYRYVFEFDKAELDLPELLESGGLLSIFADIYYVEEINYDENPYGTLCLYDYAIDSIDVGLKARDRTAIKQYTKS